MPLANSYNALALNNQQPEYQCLWSPMGIDASSESSFVFPTGAGAGALVPGALLSITTAGVGATPGPGGDGVFTVALVDLAAVSATTLLAGVLLGISTLGGLAPTTVADPDALTALSSGAIAPVAMVGTKGICQVLCDNTTTIGHTLNVSSTSTHTGQVSDSGGTTATIMATVGVALQAVTVSGAPKLVWAKIDVAYSV